MKTSNRKSSKYEPNKVLGNHKIIEYNPDKKKYLCECIKCHHQLLLSSTVIANKRCSKCCRKKKTVVIQEDTDGSFKDIAKRLGITTQEASQCYYGALKKIHEIIHQDDKKDVLREYLEDCEKEVIDSLF